MNLKAVWALLQQTFKEWREDKAPRLGAALAYYTIFSLSPLLVVTIAIVGLAFGQEAAQGQIVDQIRGLIGEQGARAVQEMIQSANRPGTGILATVFGVATLLLGAAGVFNQLKDALNTIWEVSPRPKAGILSTIQAHFFSFSLVLGTGFLLLVSLVVSAAIAAAGKYLAGLIPGSGGLWEGINFLLSFLVITVLFALIFKILPDATIAWGDVWIGAAVTSLLFTIGKFLIGLYLGTSSVASAYGAAGSLVVLLLWVYYSAQILFFGAEFTQVYANRYGSKVVPEKGAVPLTERARAQQGIPHGGARAAAGFAGGQSLARMAPSAGLRPNARRRTASRARVIRDGSITAAAMGTVVGLVAGVVLSTVGLLAGARRLIARGARASRRARRG